MNIWFNFAIFVLLMNEYVVFSVVHGIDSRWGVSPDLLLEHRHKGRLFAGDVLCKHKAGEQTKLSGEILLGAIYSSES